MPPETSLNARFKWNKVTWYSKLGAIILFVGVVPVLSFYIGMQYQAMLDVGLSSVIIINPHPTLKVADDLLPEIFIGESRGLVGGTNYHIMPDGTVSYQSYNGSKGKSGTVSASKELRTQLLALLASVDLRSLKNDPNPPEDAPFISLQITTNGRQYSVRTHLATNPAYTFATNIEKLLNLSFGAASVVEQVE